MNTANTAKAAKRILQIESLAKTYGKGEAKTEALRGITFDELEGEFLGIMGPAARERLRCSTASPR